MIAALASAVLTLALVVLGLIGLLFVGSLSVFAGGWLLLSNEKSRAQIRSLALEVQGGAPFARMVSGLENAIRDRPVNG